MTNNLCDDDISKVTPIRSDVVLGVDAKQAFIEAAGRAFDAMAERGRTPIACVIGMSDYEGNNIVRWIGIGRAESRMSLYMPLIGAAITQEAFCRNDE